MIEFNKDAGVNKARNYWQLVWFAAIFAVVTYLALSTRAVLNPYEVQQFIDAKRIFSVAIGALVLWYTIRAAIAEQAYGLRAQISIVVQVSILGTIFVLLSREVYDLAQSGELAQHVGRNIRWILSWIGYFSAAVASFFAISFYRQLQATTEDNHSPTNSDSKTVEANEQEELAALVKLLQRPTIYETADIDIRPDAEAFRQRQRQIDQLLAKFTEPKKP